MGAELVLATIIVIVILLCCCCGRRREHMASPEVATRVLAGIKYVYDNRLSFNDFKKHIGDNNFPFDKYSEFRVKNMTGQLDEAYIMSHL